MLPKLPSIVGGVHDDCIVELPDFIKSLDKLLNMSINSQECFGTSLIRMIDPFLSVASRGASRRIIQCFSAFCA